jgi:hypothetical protein
MQTHSKATRLTYLTCLTSNPHLKKSFLCLATLAGLSLMVSPSISTAQSPPELVAPQGPAWIRPERPMSWTVIFTYKDTPKAPLLADRPMKLTIAAIGDSTLKSLKFTKRAVDIWNAGGYTFIVNPETGEYVIQTAPNPPPVPEASNQQTTSPTPTPEEPQEISPEFQDWDSLSEFAWVKSELFQGSIKLGNDILHVYAQLPEDMLEARRAAAAAARPIAGRPTAPAAKAPPAPKWPAGPIGGLPLRPDIKVVAVDANTRRPRYLQLGEELREYVFSVPNAETLELPRPIQERLKTLRP